MYFISDIYRKHVFSAISFNSYRKCVAYNSSSFPIHLSSVLISLMLVIIKIVLLKLLVDKIFPKVV